MTLPYAFEKQVALVAVRRACALTSSVFNRLVKNETLTKGDKSPVTVGDYSAQAVVNTILGRAFPADPIVGEEDAAEMRQESNSELKNRIIALANEALTAPLGPGETSDWGLGPGQERTPEELMDAIDRGGDQGGRTGRRWTLDPIDGTKGFLRGGQYAVCLALIVDGQVVLGLIGCPNLPVKSDEPDGRKGCIFVVVKGQGAEQVTLSGDRSVPLTIPPVVPGTLNFLESVEAAHADLAFNNRISELLNITRAPARMDSQAKYGCLARGDGGAYLRMPTGTGYREKIWDHASGSLLVEECGGVITDSRGKSLDFGLGRSLGENYGFIAAGKDVHGQVLAAVQQALAETTLLFVGFILAVLYVARAISSRFQSTKASLEQRGITLSRDGVSLKTEGRFDRDAYLDATQRGLVKALGAATVGSESHKHAFLPPADERQKHVFGVSLRRSHGNDERGEGH
ncbi:hypothetical protein JVT61DRAFT_8081 [Boletus reticuloceps]|uniref:3'(2'),5'-bisphosphate nucleotidase n=1 Tax=Boletus reticuloceps TaxID=495285 RepID=A0A8I2YZQ6_9AGAM|nr:hypothetical protein JVT61DRAFT_8081 [Boletus reticuloceps]